MSANVLGTVHALKVLDPVLRVMPALQENMRRLDDAVRMLDGKVVGEEATQRAAEGAQPLVAEKA